MSEEVDQHVLDNPYLDVAEDTKESHGMLVFGLLAACLLLTFFTLMNWYLRPPVVTFTRGITVKVEQYFDWGRACQHLPPCPHGRTCRVDPTCTITVLP